MELLFLSTSIYFLKAQSVFYSGDVTQNCSSSSPCHRRYHGHDHHGHDHHGHDHHGHDHHGHDHHGHDHHGHDHHGHDHHGHDHHGHDHHGHDHHDHHLNQQHQHYHHHHNQQHHHHHHLHHQHQHHHHHQDTNENTFVVLNPHFAQCSLRTALHGVHEIRSSCTLQAPQPTTPVYSSRSEPRRGIGQVLASLQVALAAPWLCPPLG
ncbi:uncharacterized histidine-rich protein DDB_G0274557-like [Thrips palmi]|uniref:Uncharacterized histidine-rich protein DDB_G0274557-like n=1 Tax=Thrips palmi TaxID=161013 RepID=A0A6P8Z2S1_THRPL|nr:uncharacterized histidine-rich protein DDB_G0274557-like [Thrips palmi]